MSDTTVVDFVPGRPIPLHRDQAVALKGRGGGPRPVAFADVYAATPALSIAEALDRLTRMSRAPDQDRYTTELVSHPAPALEQAVSPSRSLEWVLAMSRPFRIAQTSDQKIANSLAWIHANLSAAAEDEHRPPEDLFTAYALLLKADDYFLARNVTPNASMALQKRIINALCPGAAHRDRERAHRVNASALAFLESLAPCADALEAITRSAFSGTTWFAQPQDGPQDAPIGGGLGQALTGRAGWGQDARQEFMAAVLGATRAVMILDDCGEVVFDLSLVQELLRMKPDLVFSLMVNRTSDGINVSAAQVRELLAGRHFSTLQAYFRAGRLEIVEVDQGLPAFEPAFFTPHQAALIESADVVLVKGASFFETVVLDRPAFHAFVVHSMSSALLTGLAPGSGVFLRSTDDTGRTLATTDLSS